MQPQQTWSNIVQIEVINTKLIIYEIFPTAQGAKYVVVLATGPITLDRLSSQNFPRQILWKVH